MRSIFPAVSARRAHFAVAPLVAAATTAIWAGLPAAAANAPAELTGHLVSAKGGAVPGALVRLIATGPGGTQLASTVTDTNGHFAFTGVAAGTVTIGFQGPPGSTLPDAFYQGVCASAVAYDADDPRVTTITLGAGATVDVLAAMPTSCVNPGPAAAPTAAKPAAEATGDPAAAANANPIAQASQQQGAAAAAAAATSTSVVPTQDPAQGGAATNGVPPWAVGAQEIAGSDPTRTVTPADVARIAAERKAAAAAATTGTAAVPDDASQPAAAGSATGAAATDTTLDAQAKAVVAQARKAAATRGHDGAPVGLVLGGLVAFAAVGAGAIVLRRRSSSLSAARS